MKFTANVKALHRAINQVGIKAAKGNVTPLTLSAQGETVTISSHHIYESRSVTIPAVVEADGNVTGTFQTIKTQFGRVGGKSVTVEIPPDHEITDKLSAQFDICKASFPFRYEWSEASSPPPREFQKVAEIPAPVLLGLICTVRHAQHRDSESYFKPQLWGMHFAPEGEGVRVATTDGHRLMIARHKTPFSRAVFLNGDMVNFLAAAVPAKSEDVVQIYLSPGATDAEGKKTDEDRVKVVCGGVAVQDMSDDRFPNYPAIIPTRGGKVQITIEPKAVAPLFSAISRLGTERNRCGAVLKFGYNNSMRVASSSNLFGTELEGVAEFTGTVSEPLKLIVGAKYLVESLPHLGKAPVLEANGEYNPLAIYGSKGDIETCAVIMPMRA